MWWIIGIITVLIGFPMLAFIVVYAFAFFADDPMWEEIALEEQERRDGLRSNE
jgi:uncharacterized membrane protein YbaN (DUF454 family)